MTVPADVTVVGIGADGWAGLAEPRPRRPSRGADVLLGGPRQLALVPGHTDAEARAGPRPCCPRCPTLFAGQRGRRVCVLASGDPMLYGLGATLARLLGGRCEVLPHPSSVALACARLGWAAESVEVVSAVGRPLARWCAGCSRRARRVLVLERRRGHPGRRSPRCSPTPASARLG